MSLVVAPLRRVVPTVDRCDRTTGRGSRPPWDLRGCVCRCRGPVGAEPLLQTDTQWDPFRPHPRYRPPIPSPTRRGIGNTGFQGGFQSCSPSNHYSFDHPESLPFTEQVPIRHSLSGKTRRTRETDDVGPGHERNGESTWGPETPGLRSSLCPGREPVPRTWRGPRVPVPVVVPPPTPSGVGHESEERGLGSRVLRPHGRTSPGADGAPGATEGSRTGPSRSRPGLVSPRVPPQQTQVGSLGASRTRLREEP